MLIDQVTKLEEAQSAHDQEEVELLQELKKKKEEVEQLKKDFDHLQNLDTVLSKSLGIMSSQITKVISYEDQASTYYDEIFEVLNDQTAEDLLKKMQVLLDNITVIETYLTGEFSNYFKTTSQSIIDQIEIVKKHIEDLKKQGIALGKKMRDLQAKEDEELRLKEQQEREKQKKIKEQAERTWLSPIFDAITWTWKVLRDSVALIIGKISDLFTWIIGSSKTEKIKQPEVQEVPPVPEIEEPEYERGIQAPVQENTPTEAQPLPPISTTVPGNHLEQTGVIPPVPAVPVIKEAPPAVTMQPASMPEQGNASQVPQIPAPMPGQEVNHAGVQVLPLESTMPLPHAEVKTPHQAPTINMPAPGTEATLVPPVTMPPAQANVQETEHAQANTEVKPLETPLNIEPEVSPAHA